MKGCWKFKTLLAPVIIRLTSLCFGAGSFRRLCVTVRTTLWLLQAARVSLEEGGCESQRCRPAKSLFSFATNGFRAAFLDFGTLSRQTRSEISFARISHTSREEGGETDLKHSLVRTETDAH